MKFVVLIVSIFLLASGCTENIKDGKEIVSYETTGQTLTKNILCQPTEEDLVAKYQEYEDKMDVKLEDLPKCADFKPSDIKGSGIWEAIFVKPLAWAILNIGELVKNMGVSVMILGLLIRVILFPLSRKSTMQSENMKKAQPELNNIEKKYESLIKNAPGDKVSELNMAKSQETMMIYKKYGINPVSGCLVALIQLPIFFAFLEAINRVPAIFEDTLMGMRLGMTPFKGIASGQFYLYIILLVLIIASTYFSMKGSMSQGSGEVAKQMAFMSKAMMIVIAVASLNLPTAIALYWIVTNAFQIVQTLVTKKITTKNSPKSKGAKKVKEAKISKKRGK